MIAKVTHAAMDGRFVIFAIMDGRKGKQ